MYTAIGTLSAPMNSTTASVLSDGPFGFGSCRHSSLLLNRSRLTFRSTFVWPYPTRAGASLDLAIPAASTIASATVRAVGGPCPSPWVFELCVCVAETMKFSGGQPVAADARVTASFTRAVDTPPRSKPTSTAQPLTIIDHDDAGEQRIANRIGGDGEVARLRRDLHLGGAARTRPAGVCRLSTTWARHAMNATAPANARIPLLLVRIMFSPAAAGYAGIFRSVWAFSHVIFLKISADVDRFRTVSVSRATHLPANRAAAGVVPLAHAAAVAIGAAAIAAEQQLVLMATQEIRGERRVARKHVVARVRGQIPIEIWIVAEQFVRDASANDPDRTDTQPRRDSQRSHSPRTRRHDR